MNAISFTDYEIGEPSAGLIDSCEATSVRFSGKRDEKNYIGEYYMISDLENSTAIGLLFTLDADNPDSEALLDKIKSDM